MAAYRGRLEANLPRDAKEVVHISSFLFKSYGVVNTTCSAVQLTRSDGSK